MKHRNKPLRPIFSKYHANTRNVCFPIKRFVTMFSIYELLTNFGVFCVKVMILQCKRPALTSQFDVSKLQKQLQSVIQTHLDQYANFCSLMLTVCVTVGHNTAFNNINHLK